jgi:EAL domain-containing protein (putative c-di-GMP-specific phosphodiesterase class I)/FixJ family two-component response regulator
MRMLVFDDDAAVGRLVTRVATLTGLEATSVTEPEAFRQSLTDAPPQVILLDLQLGVTDGVEQLRYLAEQHYGGAIVVMSGFDARVLAATATVAKNLELNIAATLAKPIRVAELEEVIERLKSVRQPISGDELLAAIRDNELSLEFQPIVSWRPRTLNKLEALVRWDHPEFGQISPADFLPLAETNRATIDALTDWVIGAAVEAWGVLRELDVNVPITVNVSTLNLHDITLPDRLARRLAAAGMPAEQLCLEITETAASRDTARMMDILTRARLKGFQLAIDDFGTGYSSLKALRQLPFSVIKIDRSFVSDMTTSPDSRAIVKSIIGLAANMNMATIAEGVETEETAELLEHMNVDALQGYLIARSMPVEAIASWRTLWVAGDGSDGAGTDDAETDDAGTDDAGTGPGDAGDPAGDRVMAQGGMSGGMSGAVSGVATVGARCLSARQTDVMQLLTEGCSVKEIARRLGLSIGAVTVDLSHAYSILGARDRTEAIVRAGLWPQQGAA